MGKASITKRTVDAAKRATRDSFVWDDEISGFGLKVTPAGGKVYLYQYRRPQAGAQRAAPITRYTIGKHGPITAEQARKRARELAAMVAQGVDPRQQEVDAVEERARRAAA